MNAQRFQELIIPFQDKMFRYAFSILTSEAEAEDVVQDVILKLWEKRDQLATIDNIEAWLIRATKNRCIDMMRAKSRNHSSLDSVVEMSSKENSPAKYTESNDTMAMLRNMMNSLSQIQRSTLLLRDVEGFTYEEIAETLEITLSQVKINIHRARQNMKMQLIKANIHGYQ